MADSFIAGAKSILEFPFGAPVCKTDKKLEKEY